MTELLSQARLQEMAAPPEVSANPAHRPTLVCCWTVDAATGRPVCHWEMEPCSTER